MTHVIFENNRQIAVSTIYCIGRNYSEHAKELGNEVPKEEPVVFLKSRSSVRGLGREPLGFDDDHYHFESELVLLVGQNVPLGSVPDWSCILGVGLGLDLTRRDVQSTLKSKGLPWTTAKSFAGSAILSPLIDVKDLPPTKDFAFKFFLNGDLKQVGDTKGMIFSIPAILKYLASFNNLLPGDLIFTGTPAGVGPIKSGESFVIELQEPHRRWHGIL